MCYTGMIQSGDIDNIFLINLIILRPLIHQIPRIEELQYVQPICAIQERSPVDESTWHHSLGPRYYR